MLKPQESPEVIEDKIYENVKSSFSIKPIIGYIFFIVVDIIGMIYAYVINELKLGMLFVLLVHVLPNILMKNAEKTIDC